MDNPPQQKNAIRLQCLFPFACPLCFLFGTWPSILVSVLSSVVHFVSSVLSVFFSFLCRFVNHDVDTAQAPDLGQRLG